MCRGPVQVLREDADANRQKRGLSTEKGRARLEAFMQDCPGDHVLFLRIFEVQTLSRVIQDTIKAASCTLVLTSQ